MFAPSVALLAAVAAADPWSRVPEGATALAPAPRPSLPFEVPDVEVVWTPGELHVMSWARGALPRVWLAGTASDGGVALKGHDQTTLFTADGHPIVSFPAVGVAPVGDLWLVAHGSGVTVRSGRGAVEREVALPGCDIVAATAVPDGIRVVCRDGETHRVGVDGVGDGTVRWPLLDGALEWGPGPDAKVRALGPDGEVRWEMASRASVAPAPDGAQVLVGNTVLDARTGEERRIDTVLGGWTADGDLWAALYPWQRVDPATGRFRTRPDGHGGPVTALAWHPDGARLASAGADGSVLVWDVDGALLHRLDGRSSGVRRLVWHPDGRLLVWEDGQWLAWPLEGPATLLVRAPEGGLVVRPEGEVLAVAADGAIETLDPDGAVLQRRTLHGNPRVTQLFDVAGRTFAVAGDALFELGRDEPVLDGLSGIVVEGDGVWRLPPWTVAETPTWWSPTGAGPPPVPRLPSARVEARTADGQRAAVSMGDGAIWVLPLAPGEVRDRRPRDVVLLVPPEVLPDPERLVAALRVAHVDGDRIAWVVPGTSRPPRWIDLHDPRAARSLAAQRERGLRRRDPERLSLAAGLAEGLWDGAPAPSDGGPWRIVIVHGDSSAVLSELGGSYQRGHHTMVSGVGAAEILERVRAGW